MLEDQSNFGFTNKEGTHVQSLAKSIALVPNLIVTFIFGTLMDLIGRRATMSLGLILTGISLGLLPFTYPSIPLLFSALISEDIFMSTLQSNPLLVDYAPRES